MVWKKSKSHHAWKAKNTEVMQENHFSCYFSHTVCPDLSECQTQMSRVIEHCFMKSLDLDLACLHVSIQWRKMSYVMAMDLRKTQKQHYKAFSPFYLLFWFIWHQIWTLLNIRENPWRSLTSKRRFGEKIKLYQQISSFVFPSKIFLNTGLSYQSILNLMAFINEVWWGVICNALVTKTLWPAWSLNK